eukprot:185541_1
MMRWAPKRHPNTNSMCSKSNAAPLTMLPNSVSEFSQQKLVKMKETNSSSKNKLLNTVSGVTQQTLALFVALKLQQKFVKSLNLPHTNIQRIVFAAITSYKLQQHFQSISWRWTLIGMTKLFAQMFTEICPNKYKLLTTSGALQLVHIYLCYLLNQKIRLTPKSHLKFSDNCFGDAYQLQKHIHSYHEEINNYSSSSCQKHLHPNQSCMEYIGHGAARWINTFK